MQLLPGEEVLRFETSGGAVRRVITTVGAREADVVVLATGSWSREIAALLGPGCRLVPGRGYSVTLEDSPYRVNYPAILVEGRAAITPMDGNKIRFGGTMEITATSTPPRYARVRGILNAVKTVLSGFRCADAAGGEDLVWIPAMFGGWAALYRSDQEIFECGGGDGAFDAGVEPGGGNG